MTQLCTFLFVSCPLRSALLFVLLFLILIALFSFVFYCFCFPPFVVLSFLIIFLMVFMHPCFQWKLVSIWKWFYCLNFLLFLSITPPIAYRGLILLWLWCNLTLILYSFFVSYICVWHSSLLEWRNLFGVSCLWWWLFVRLCRDWIHRTYLPVR